MPPTIWLRKGVKALGENLPIPMNDVLNFYRQVRSEL